MNVIRNRDHFGALFNKTDQGQEFIGSCFLFVHEKRNFVCTADHVVRRYNGQFFMARYDRAYPLKLVVSDSGIDVALLELDDELQLDLTLSPDSGVPGNVELLTYEYSTTEVRDGRFNLNPATRRGNCVRTIQMSEIFGQAGIDMLELSFPALKGASGAAVVQLQGTQMVARGMIVANTERHLLPAQIETVLDQKNDVVEERKYFLPQAAAVNSSHIVKLVKSL